MHLTYQELKDQYAALRRTYAHIMGRRDELLAFRERHAPRKIAYLACGSSYYISQSAALSAWIRLGLPSLAMPAGDLMLHHDTYRGILADALLIAPTRSGSTSEVLLALDKAKKQEPIRPVLAVTCVENGEVAGLADYVLELPWAFDASVCQTRTVSNLYAANLLLIAIWCGGQGLIDDLGRAIETGPAFMDRFETKLAGIAREPWRRVVVLADGELRGIAREGALAFTEIARVPGSYHHLLDVRHGPMVLVGEDTLVLAALSREGAQYEEGLLADLIKQGATVVTYSDTPAPPRPGTKLHADSGCGMDPAARGLHFIFLAQALAYYKAVHKGVNPDQPEGLDAWIKL